VVERIINHPIVDIFSSLGLPFRSMIEGKLDPKMPTKPVHPETNLLFPISLFLFLGLFCSTAFGQAVIENPEKPASQRAGRVVKLKEVMRITDAGGRYFFASPWAIHVADDGFFYVQEPEHLYQFEEGGRFVRDLYKKGEGPGEFNQSLTEVLISGSEIIFHSANMNKILLLGHPQGNLLEDFRPRDRVPSKILGYHQGQFTVLLKEMKERERITGLYVEDYRLCVIDRDSNIKPTSVLFPFTISLFIRERGSSVGYISRWLTANDEPRYVYLSSKPDYLVGLVDLDKGEVIRSFKRKYDRTKFIMKQKVPPGYPIPPYVNDICALLIHRNSLWVVTSTIDKAKGLLVDVFSREGKYLDNFWLPHFRIRTEDRHNYYAPMALLDNFLFVIEITEDDLISVAKYEIIDQ